jgi:hypothetical protein
MFIMLNETKRSRGQAAAYAGLLTLLQAVPWFVLLASGVSLISVANESIAYRYFHSFRLVQGEAGTIWEAQGQTLGVFHVILQQGLDALGVETLRQRIDLFSYATLGANSLLLGVVAFRFARNPAMSRGALIALGGILVFGVYGSAWALMSARMPDYYTLEVTGTVVALGWALLRWSGAAPCRDGVEALLMGAFAGLLAGVKITLIPTALVPLLALLLVRPRSPREIAKLAATWLLTAVASLSLILLAYYQFDLGHMGRAFGAWRTFVLAPGSEPRFIDNLQAAFRGEVANGSDLSFVWVVLTSWLVTVGRWILGCWHHRGAGSARPVWMGAALIFASALHLYAVTRRPAETTLFESGIFLVAVSAFLALETGTAGRSGRGGISWWAAGLFIWCGFSAARHLPNRELIHVFRSSGEAAWEIHHLINESRTPVTVLLPDNSATSGTLEDALLKGFSDVPTWSVSTGYDLLERVAPGRHYVQQLDFPPPGHLLLWADDPTGVPFAERHPAIGRLLALPGTAVSTWTLQRKAGWIRTVHLVRPALGEQEALPPILVGEDQWRASSEARPQASFTISPAEAQPRLELMQEGGRTFLRVTATRAGAYLAVTGAIPPRPDPSGPHIARAAVRTDRPRSAVVQIYDVVDAEGAAETAVESSTIPGGRWALLAVKANALRFNHPSDNFSVGLLNLKPGDVLDVEFLELRGPGP